jgi:hypothetical protein
MLHSYIRQRNSFTRLRITKPVFQDLVEGCAIFPRFNEYVLDYRWKKRESEVGPPPIRFRLLSDDGYGKSASTSISSCLKSHQNARTASDM